MLNDFKPASEGFVRTFLREQTEQAQVRADWRNVAPTTPEELHQQELEAAITYLSHSHVVAKGDEIALAHGAFRAAGTLLTEVLLLRAENARLREQIKGA